MTETKITVTCQRCWGKGWLDTVDAHGTPVHEDPCTKCAGTGQMASGLDLDPSISTKEDSLVSSMVTVLADLDTCKIRLKKIMDKLGI
jgi:DnaJ-class molecular chaperone